MIPFFFYAIINKMKIPMNKGKLKVLVMALKEVVLLLVLVSHTKSKISTKSSSLREGKPMKESEFHI